MNVVLSLFCWLWASFCQLGKHDWNFNFIIILDFLWWSSPSYWSLCLLRAWQEISVIYQQLGVSIFLVNNNLQSLSWNMRHLRFACGDENPLKFVKSIKYYANGCRLRRGRFNWTSYGRPVDVTRTSIIIANFCFSLPSVGHHYADLQYGRS